MDNLTGLRVGSLRMDAVKEAFDRARIENGKHFDTWVDAFWKDMSMAIAGQENWIEKNAVLGKVLAVGSRTDTTSFVLLDLGTVFGRTFAVATKGMREGSLLRVKIRKFKKGFQNGIWEAI